MNFDAAVWEDGRASVLCVARDAAEALLLAAGFRCEYDTAVEAEVRAAW